MRYEPYNVPRIAERAFHLSTVRGRHFDIAESSLKRTQHVRKLVCIVCVDDITYESVSTPHTHTHSSRMQTSMFSPCSGHSGDARRFGENLRRCAAICRTVYDRRALFGLWLCGPNVVLRSSGSTEPSSSAGFRANTNTRTAKPSLTYTLNWCVCMWYICLS